MARGLSVRRTGIFRPASLNPVNGTAPYRPVRPSLAKNLTPYRPARPSPARKLAAYRPVRPPPVRKLPTYRPARPSPVRKLPTYRPADGIPPSSLAPYRFENSQKIRNLAKNSRSRPVTGENRARRRCPKLKTSAGIMALTAVGPVARRPDIDRTAVTLRCEDFWTHARFRRLTLRRRLQTGAFGGQRTARPTNSTACCSRRIW
jgi:hypothetical protein